MKKYNILFFSCFIFFYQTSFLGAQTFNLARFSIGESRIQIDLKDFYVQHENENISTFWKPSSIQWIRNENNLLTPRALLKIIIKNKPESVHLSYQDKSIFLVTKNNAVEAEVYVELFNPDIISV